CCLLVGLCARLLYNSFHARDALGSYLCVGAFAMVAFQSIFNIGMCLSILPVIGITLPFLSSGGTSVVALYAAMGLVVSVKMHSSTKMFG
ncbi:MAG: FtsW/RodA/SpoVE family cell cycle protein, partial [Oscillospiraceae bacterium]|nr:FtsW/RodA/SpoVE family cell cycle protein [Oscillospiraceae bacterium]